MKKILVIFFINILAISSALSKTSLKKTSKLKVASSHKMLSSISYLPKKTNLTLKSSYGLSTMQSTNAPYRVGVLNNEGLNLAPLLEYKFTHLLSLAIGPSLTLARKSGEDGFFQGDVTKLSYEEYKLESIVFLNLSTGQTLFRPYLKASLGYAKFELGFSKDNEGFSELNDSIVGIEGKGLVSEFGIGAEIYLYKGLGFFSEISYKSFSVKKVKYDIQSDLAEYEQSLVSSKNGAKFNGLSVLYGMALRF